jgi:YidC/Oxa1 family membrane protein insertase
MSSTPNPGFFDSKTLLAVALVGFSWLGWQYYMQSKYPNLYSKPTATESTAPEQKTSETKNQEKNESLPAQALNGSSDKNDEHSLKETRSLKSVHFEDNIWSFDISPMGMGLENIKLNDYTERTGEPKSIGSNQEGLSYSTSLLGQTTPLYFEIQKVGANEFVGKAQVGLAQVEKRMTISSENHSIETKILVTGVDKELTFSGLSTFLGEKLHNPDSGIPLLPAFEIQEVFAISDGKENRILFSGENSEMNLAKVKVAAISTQYFTQALLDKSDIMPEIKAQVSQDKMYAQANLNHNLINRSQDFFVNYLAFVGPKSLDLLNKIDSNMAGIIDFGWFSGLAKIILYVMKAFHNIFGNWGVAIILMTILVRIVVLPFNLMSFKSMKKMQELQPYMKELREKFKDEPQKLNQEMMNLFKTHKANPMGGCLPMLLQFPVFIALYRMLGQSIELYQAPFMFWINDLSLKDPFFVLPVLMGLTMFAQQKLTPTTMDPAQQKIFMFMPIIFSLFMITLPSGLTLYIFVSALFAVIQQAIIMRDNKKQTVKI